MSNLHSVLLRCFNSLFFFILINKLFVCSLHSWLAVQVFVVSAAQSALASGSKCQS